MPAVTRPARRVLFVRHAESTANVDHNLHCEAPGPELTEQGRQQAEDLVAAVGHRLPQGPPVVRLWCSTMVRTQQSAAPLARACGLAPHIDDRLREGHIGDLHGRHDDQALTAFAELALTWNTGDLEAKRPGGESAREVAERFAAVCAEIVADLPEPGTAVVFGHGMLLSLGLMAVVEGVGPELIRQGPLRNAAIVDTEAGPDGRLRLRQWGATGTPFTVPPPPGR